jgi:hypothetical protein
MKSHNTYVLMVSATPFAHLAKNNTRPKLCVFLGTIPDDPNDPEKPGYFGVRNMIANGNVIDNTSEEALKMFTSDTPVAIGEAVLNFLDVHLAPLDTGGFIIVRESTNSPETGIWVSQLKAYLDSKSLLDADFKKQYSYFDFNQKTADSLLMVYSKCIDLDFFYILLNEQEKNSKVPPLDIILKHPPFKYVFVFLKEMLKAGKNLETDHVRMIIDVPILKPNYIAPCYTIAQGLVGRCCGYNKNKEVVLVTYEQAVRDYIKWLDDEEDPTRASITTQKTATGLKVRKSSALFAKEEDLPYDQNEFEVPEISEPELEDWGDEDDDHFMDEMDLREAFGVLVTEVRDLKEEIRDLKLHDSDSEDDDISNYKVHKNSSKNKKSKK